MTKKCNGCLMEYPIDEFNKHPSTADRRSNFCKKCKNRRQRDYRKDRGGNLKTLIYEKTFKGFLVRLYRNMKSRIEGVQKKKFHLYENKELLNKEDFYEWALKNDDYKRLFDEYTQYGYQRKIAPSVDRIDSKIGYIISNMRFVTHSENSKHTSRRKINP